MSRILLLRPPAVFSASTYSSPLTMPLALAYLAANLRRAGHEVEVLDALGAALDHIAESYSPRVRYRGLSTVDILARLNGPYDGIGVSVMFSQDWPHVEDLLIALQAKFPGTPILLGGEHATAAGAYVLETCAAVTAIALGEGEQTILGWAEHLDNQSPLDEVPGLLVRDGNGGAKATPPRARLGNPDELPWPAWEMFELEPYFAAGDGHGVERGRSMPILATRGCPYRCTFCSSPQMWTTRYVARPVAKVLDEIEHYIQHYRADNIDFFDLTAVVKKSWIVEFCQEIERRGLKFTWQLPSGTRSEAMDAEVMALMAKSGCMNVTYAPESGSPNTLKEIKKLVKLDKMYTSIRAAKANGIFVKCNLIIGFPKETRQDMWQTVATALRFAVMGVDDTGVYPFSPYPGTELYDYLRTKGTIGKMDRDYFEGLMIFMDLKRTVNYCENVGAKEIAAYRFIGMAGFYGLSFLLRPQRILRGIRNFMRHRSDTVFEERLFSYFRRLRPATLPKSPAPAP